MPRCRSWRTRSAGDYLLFVLYSGLRRNDAATARWSDVDWTNAALTVPAPKGGRPFQLPLSKQLLALLRARQACEVASTLHPKSEWIFPSKSAAGHIAEPREELEVNFTIHSLRNTFITVAESLDISPYAIKMLVNHGTPDRQDVTAGYITPELQRLRDPMQRVSDQLDKLLAGNADRESHLKLHRDAQEARRA
jgi:integrase